MIRSPKGSRKTLPDSSHHPCFQRPRCLATPFPFPGLSFRCFRSPDPFRWRTTQAAVVILGMILLAMQCAKMILPADIGILHWEQRHDARNIVDRMPSMVTCSKLSPRGLWMHSNRPKEGLRSVHKGSLGGASRSSYQEGWLHISVPLIESTSSTRGGGMGGSGIQVGKVYELRRIFSQHDVDEFARMSGDLNPMHKADSEVAFRWKAPWTSLFLSIFCVHQSDGH